METFIRVYDGLDKQTCRQIIDIHKRHPFRGPGKSGSYEVNKDVKDSIDSGYKNGHHLPNSMIKALMALGDCLQSYIKDIPDADGVAPFRIMEGFNVQEYPPGGGYHNRHCERTDHRTSLRHLVWMIYLNTVTDGGQTAFPNQELLVDAVAGRIVIWPSDWTHSHYGVVSPTQEKFIMTGWYSYL
jgi:prolyl 4-hydroxylase